MTGLLKESLREQAETQTVPRFDAATIMSAGNRRVARRRVVAGSLAVAAVTLAAVALPQLAGVGGTTGADGLVAQQGRDATRAFAERRPTYAVGTVIHYGEDTIEVGETVGSFVQTDDGFVYATDNGEIHLADGATTEEIGRTSRDGLYLRADDSGSLVAWVEFTGGRAPELVVYDTAARDEVARTAEGTEPEMSAFRDTDAAYVYAVDDGTVYWRSADGLVALDVAEGTSEVLLADAVPSDVADVADGTFAHRVQRPDGEDEVLRVSTDLTDPARPLPSGWKGHLSPGARYISVEVGDEIAVYDTSTHEEVTPDTDGYEFVAIYSWLDDGTVAMIGIERLGGAQPIDILTCEVPAGACTVAADDVATYSEDGPVPLALPVGERLE